jgi:hypothetical protein
LDEALRRPSLPLVQGLIGLSAYEGNLRDATQSKTYIKLIFENYLKLNLNSLGKQPDAIFHGTRKDRAWQAISKFAWGVYLTDWYA